MLLFILQSKLDYFPTVLLEYHVSIPAYLINVFSLKGIFYFSSNALVDALFHIQQAPHSCQKV